MRGIARLLFLVLIAVMVGANIPITTPASEPALDLGMEEGTTTFVIGEDGEGLTYEARVATTSDVIGMMDACGVFDPSTDYKYSVAQFRTYLVTHIQLYSFIFY